MVFSFLFFPLALFAREGRLLVLMFRGGGAARGFFLGGERGNEGEARFRLFLFGDSGRVEGWFLAWIRRAMLGGVVGAEVQGMGGGRMDRSVDDGGLVHTGVGRDMVAVGLENDMLVLHAVKVAVGRMMLRGFGGNEGA